MLFARQVNVLEAAYDGLAGLAKLKTLSADRLNRDLVHHSVLHFLRADDMIKTPLVLIEPLPWCGVVLLLTGPIGAGRKGQNPSLQLYRGLPGGLCGCRAKPGVCQGGCEYT